MTQETEELMRTGLDVPNQLGDKMRTDSAAIDGAVNGQVALRTSIDGVRTNVQTQRNNLAAQSSGNTTDNAVNASVDLEQEVQQVLDESAEIEQAVAEAAETLKVGQIENDRIRDEIIKDIAKTLKTVAALRAQPDGKGNAAAQKLLTDLLARVQEATGRSADNAQATIASLSTLAGDLGGGQPTAPSGSGGGGSSAPVAFNAGGHGGGGGGGGGGGSVSKPRLPVAIPPQPGTGVDVNLPDGSTVKAPNETAAKAVRAAISNLGVPYVWGGTSPGAGLDCSGLTMTSYEEAGLEIPRKSNQQTVGAEVPSMDQLLPGDLVVWSGHVAMVVGNGQMIEAGDPVQIGPIRTENAGQQFIGFYRPTG
ncbi:C40 family peptidase [Amycolatopsis cihanbeyliensis]|uniref:NlpC/P60 family protein n=1 Tax=Amycolatopsis cihanbeyliensis TaxID=1128664 RepID=A0A542DQC9_AMYCI|nr:C40 family peptidase [Amycolatopsis cihanbeyliensis]TQJ05194.1 NlpC/P60 family protein [Amycolatopsis cihanbeyliensis]